ncbi:Prefoldin [Hypoxylon sp. FL0890]|nr:Prefoldin [Hypoxylon sp. FL0890]
MYSVYRAYTVRLSPHRTGPPLRLYLGLLDTTCTYTPQSFPVSSHMFKYTIVRYNPIASSSPDFKSKSKGQVTMSISNEALQKLLREVETQAIAAQQQISLVRTQQASKQRELRMAQLTRTEMSSLPADTNVYEGVGKMFVALPVSDMKNKLDAQIKEVEGEVDGLGKRLHYLEISQKNSKDQIDRMLRGAS